MCGRELPPGAPDGLCPRCLLAIGAGALGITPAAENNQEESAPAAAAVGLFRPGTRLGDYELLERIGQGGMGVVYKARQISLGRLVAIKLLPFGRFQQPAALTRFRAEASAAASLKHPNIVAIHEIGEHDGQPYFSMDYVEGQSLATLMAGQSLPPRRAAVYVRTIAEAIHFAHEHGILHRDLKPANVLIDAHDQPQVTDFGLARRLESDSDLTVSGQVLGSPNYMPPEQARGERGAVDRRADVYALGAILYQALAGRPPFLGEGVAETVQQLLTVEPTALRVLNPVTPVDLETICLKCLEKDPVRRYATARELAEELDRFLQGHPVQARPIGLAEKARRWCQRNPKLAAALAVAVASLGFGFVGVTWQWSRARQLAQAELQQRQRAQDSEYAADMHLAQLALADGNRALAVSLLNKHKDGPSRGPDSGARLRGWEWRYLWKLVQGEQSFTLRRYPDSINSLALSGDGKLLAVGTPKEVGVWELATRRIVARRSIGVGSGLAFSPMNSLLAVSTWDRQGRHVMELWDPELKHLRGTVPHQAKISSAAFSPQGNLLASFDTQGKVRIADLVGGTNVTELDASPTRYAFAGAVAFSPDGSRLAIGEDYGQLRIWDLHAGNSQLLSTGTSASISTIAFSRDGELVAAGFGYLEGYVRLWKVPSGQLAGQLKAHTGDVTALAFTPDGRQLITASGDGTIRSFDPSDLSETRPLRSSPEGIASLVLLPDGKTLITGGQGGSVYFWDLSESNRHSTHASFASSRGFNAFIGLKPADFQAKTLNPLAVLRFGVAFTPDSASFIALNTEGALERWDARRLQLVESLPVFGSDHWALALSPDGRWLATGNFPEGITIWDWKARQSITNLALPFEWFGLLEFATNGNYLVARAGFNNHTFVVKIWETRGWPEVTLTPAQAGGLWSVSFSPDGRLLACGYASGGVKIFSFPSGEPVAAFTPHRSSVTSVRFSPDGGSVYTTSFDSTAAILDLKQHSPLALLRGHSSLVLASALWPGAPRLVTGGSTPKDAVKLWDLTTQREILSLPGEGKWYLHVALSPDGNTLAATALSGCTDVWHAPSWEDIEAAEKEEASHAPGAISAD
jgi:eukaryotic-like serine/threonine-protein kinase